MPVQMRILRHFILHLDYVLYLGVTRNSKCSEEPKFFKV